MSKLLDQAIEQLRELPEDEQDAAADVVFAFMTSDERQYSLGPDQAAEVRRIRERIRAGMTRLAHPGEVAKIKSKSIV